MHLNVTLYVHCLPCKTPSGNCEEKPRSLANPLHAPQQTFISNTNVTANVQLSGTRQEAHMKETNPSGICYLISTTVVAECSNICLNQTEDHKHGTV